MQSGGADTQDKIYHKLYTESQDSNIHNYFNIEANIS